MTPTTAPKKEKKAINHWQTETEALQRQGSKHQCF